MKKWTWEWLALLGLAGMTFFVADWVMAELLPCTHVVDEYAIEVYHEPLYYDYYFLKKVEKKRLRMGEGMELTTFAGETGEKSETGETKGRLQICRRWR